MTCFVDSGPHASGGHDAGFSGRLQDLTLCRNARVQLRNKGGRGMVLRIEGVSGKLPVLHRWREWAGFTLRAFLGRKILLRIVLACFSARFFPRRFLVRYVRYPGVLAEVEDILRRVRSIRGWSREWARAATARTERAQAALETGAHLTAFEHELAAALYFHGASSTLCTGGQARHDNMALADAAFARAMLLAGSQSAGRLLGIADAIRLEIFWGASSFGGWLLLPFSAEQGPPAATVVIPGGADSGKEEYVHYARHFLLRGLAVLVMNDPGVGETAGRLPLAPDGAALFDAVRAALAGTSDGMYARKMFWLGASLGGWKVMQVAVSRTRADGLAGVVSISGPYRPERYFGRLVFAIHEMIRFALGGARRSEIRRLLARCSLDGALARVSVPAMIVVGGKEKIIPASDGIAMYTDTGSPDKTLLYLPDSDHVCMDAVDLVLPEIADWMLRYCPGTRDDREGA